MLIAIRHGATQLNDPANESVRGHSPVPITPESAGRMAEIGQMLHEVSPDVAGIHSSDVVRAVQSAHEIGKAYGMQIDPKPELRSFDTGSFDGQKITPALMDQIHHYISNPDQQLPGGETYNSFLERITPHLRQYVESPDRHIAIVHGRVASLLHAMSKAKGGQPDPKALVENVPVDPAGIMVIGSDWKTDYMSPRTDAGRKGLAVRSS